MDFAVDPQDKFEPEKVKVKSQVLETIKEEDSFCKHFEHDVDEKDVVAIADRKRWEKDLVEVSITHSLTQTLSHRLSHTDSHRLSHPYSLTHTLSLRLSHAAQSVIVSTRSANNPHAL